MDEAWERAVEAALDGQAAESSTSSSSPRTLNLDGAVKCLHGRLPPPSLFEKFQNLEHLSVASVGASSLEKFPRLRNLQRLILSDNRIAGGLEFLVEAGLDSLRDLDLSNNRIQFLEDLEPLAQLRLVSLDLYECPVTRVKDYRSRVFGMIRSLKYLDKMDADENERPESDDEDEDEDDDEEEEDEIDGDDPGSGEIDGEDRGKKAVNGVGGSGDEVGVVDVDEDESDADEEETETGGRREANGSDQHHSNGFRVATVGQEVDEDGDEEDVDDEEDEEEDGDDDEMGEEIDADDGEDEDVVVVHDVVDSDEDEDGVHEEEDDEDDDEVDDDDDVDVDEDEVEDEEVEREPGSTGRLMSAEGEIDGHEQGEEDEDENETGELGEADEEGVEEDRDLEDDDGDEEEDADGEYLVQPIPQAERAARGCGDSDACDEDEEEEVDDEDTRPSNGSIPSEPSSSQHSKSKRKRDDNGDLVDDSVEDLRSSKH